MKQLVTILLLLLLGISVPSMAQNREHIVKVGEDFASIAQKYGITEQQLIDANPKSHGICYVGLKLIVPQQQAPQKTDNSQSQSTTISPQIVVQEVSQKPSLHETRSNITQKESSTSLRSSQPKIKNVRISYDSDYKPVDHGLMCFGRSTFSISGRYENFMNDVFYYYSDQKDIKSQIGIEGSYTIVIYSPLALEVTGFYSTYNVEPLAKSGDKNKVVHAGFECFADAFFLPYVGTFSDYFAPYAGIGYQTSSLTWGKDISAGTGSAMIKCGAKVRLGWGLHLRLEYKQTLPSSSNKLFYACSIGLGCKL